MSKEIPMPNEKSRILTGLLVVVVLSFYIGRLWEKSSPAVLCQTALYRQDGTIVQSVYIPEGMYFEAISCAPNGTFSAHLKEFVREIRKVSHAE